MAAGAAAAVTAAAAAEAQRQQHMEEEEMTPYRREDLEEAWEFKILRSASGVFRNPDRFRQILDEEARAGWILVEKFDNNRVRLKRRPGAAPSHVDFDPYRTHVGASENQQALWVLGVILLIAAAVLIGVVVLT